MFGVMQNVGVQVGEWFVFGVAKIVRYAVFNFLQAGLALEQKFGGYIDLHVDGLGKIVLQALLQLGP